MHFGDRSRDSARAEALGPHTPVVAASGRPRRTWPRGACVRQPLAVCRCSRLRPRAPRQHTLDPFHATLPMACRSVLLALAVLAAVACAQSRELLAGAKSGGGMMQKSKESDDAVFSRGRATSGEAYLAACAPVDCALSARVGLQPSMVMLTPRPRCGGAGTRCSSTRCRLRWTATSSETPSPASLRRVQSPSNQLTSNESWHAAAAFSDSFPACSLRRRRC